MANKTTNPSLDVLREAAEVSPGNAFFATEWLAKGLPFVGMSGNHGVGLQSIHLETQETLQGFLEAVIHEYNDRTRKNLNAEHLAHTWAHNLFSGEDVRVMMYPPTHMVALDIDNAGIIEQLENTLKLREGRLTELLSETPVLSRMGHRSLHGHHYFKLPDNITVDRIKPLMAHRIDTEDPKSSLGDLIYARGKYQVVHGIHNTGINYKLYDKAGNVVPLKHIHEAPEFPKWLIEAVDSISGYSTLAKLSAEIRHEKRIGRPSCELEFASKFSVEDQLAIIESIEGVESVDTTDGLRIKHDDQSTAVPGGKVSLEDGVVRVFCFSPTVYSALLPNEPSTVGKDDPVSALEVLLSNGRRIPLSVLNARWLAYSHNETRSAKEIKQALQQVDKCINPTLQQLVQLMPEPERVEAKKLQPLHNSSRLAKLAAEAGITIDGVPATEMSSWLVRMRTVCDKHIRTAKDIQERIEADEEYHKLSEQIVRLIQAELVNKQVLITGTHIRANGQPPWRLGSPPGDAELEKHLGCGLLATFASEHRGRLVSPGWPKFVKANPTNVSRCLSDGWLHLLSGQGSTSLALVDGQDVYAAELGGVREPITNEASLVNFPISWENFYKVSEDNIDAVAEEAKRVLGLVTRLVDDWHLVRFCEAKDEYTKLEGNPVPQSETISAICLAWIHHALTGTGEAPWLAVEGAGEKAATGKSMLSSLVMTLMNGATRGSLKGLSKDGVPERRYNLIGKQVLLLEEVSYVAHDEAEFAKSLLTTGVEARFLFSNDIYITRAMPILSTSNKRLEFSKSVDDAVAMKRRTLVVKAQEWSREKHGDKDPRVVIRTSDDERKALISILTQPDTFGFAKDVKDIERHLKNAQHTNKAIHQIVYDAEVSGAYKCQITDFVETYVAYEPGGFFHADEALLLAKEVKEDWLDDTTTRQSKVGLRLIKCLRSHAERHGGRYGRYQTKNGKMQGCHDMVLLKP